MRWWYDRFCPVARSADDGETPPRTVAAAGWLPLRAVPGWAAWGGRRYRLLVQPETDDGWVGAMEAIVIARLLA
jgi:hypothetical protein